LYADGNEYILIFGSPIPSFGYSGRYFYDCYDFQIDGEQENFYVGNISTRYFSPNWKKLRAEGKDAHFSMVLAAGTQKGYAQKNGGWMVEYGRGNLVPALYDGVLLPTMFVSNDWVSLAASMYGMFEGIVGNNFPAVGRMLGLLHEHKFNSVAA